MRFFVPFRPLVVGWLVSFAVCMAFALAFSVQMSRAVSAPWGDVFRFVGRDWAVWALLAPLVFRLVSRFPIERATWKITIPLHVGVGLAVVLGFGFLMFSFGPMRVRMEKVRADPKRSHRASAFVGWIFFGPQMPIYLALLGAAHAACFSRRSAERERKTFELAASLAEARLQALRMQIQPHFLFNSLNALAALIPRNPSAAEEMLESISEFLRMTLANSDGQEVTLTRELEYARCYLAIEQVRFGDRLKFSIQAESLSARVPALLLQPLVENSVRHGIEPQAREGRIVISARRDADSLVIDVEDDGAGFSPEAVDGVGLSNTRARLHELYGGDAGMTVDRIDSRTRVRIRLPFRT